MKKLWIILFVLPITLFITACGPNSTDGKTVIEFWHMSPVGTPSFSPMRAIINEYNNSQDEYTVKGIGFSFWDYWDKLNISIPSRTTPDIGLSTIDDVVARASGKVLFNISDLMAADTSDTKLEIEEFRQSQLDFATYEGDLYALPFTSTARALYYNMDILAEKGFDASDIPTTWSELKTFSKNFNQSSGNTITRVGFDPTYGNATYHGWLWQTGEDFFDENLNPTLNTPTHVEVLEWITNFNSEFTRSQLEAFGEGNQILGTDPFSSQRVAMVVDDDGLNQKIKDSGATFNYGVAPIPIPDEGGIHVNWGSGFSIELYDKNNGNETKKQGAYDFLKFLMSKEIQIKLAQANGWIMSHITAMEEYTANDPILSALLAEVEFATDKVYVPYAPSWHGNDWQPFYNQALSHEKTAAQALLDARNHYIQKQENYNRTN